jgi:hypothetical protein
MHYAPWQFCYRPGAMAYPTQSDVLAADPVLSWIDRCFLRHDPFAFQGHDFTEIVQLVTETLDVDANGIFCIGSGAVGLSLSPGKVSGTDLKPFDDASDLDIAIISEVHFETAWRDLRRAGQPTTLSEMERGFKDALAWQKKRFFDGAIVAHKVLPYLSFGAEWAASLVRLSERTASLLDREVVVNVWIFRDYWSLRNYVARGLVECRKKVSTG